MNLFNNFFQNNPNPRGDLITSSTRGGLPQVLDMLKVYPSYFVERNDLENGNKVLLPVQRSGPRAAASSKAGARKPSTIAASAVAEKKSSAVL